MRILTNSPFEAKGLISIFEASDNAPQIVTFCVPIDKSEAERIRDIDDFQDNFSNGISTKIKDQNSTNTVYLNYVAPERNNRGNNIPKFEVNIKGHKIDFYLSSLNYNSNNNQLLNIEYYYSGTYLNNALFNKRLVLLEPNWKQLDKLFIEEKITFTDWK